MKCNHCGFENGSNPFCAQCGQPLTAPSPAVANTGGQVRYERNDKNIIIGAIALTVVLNMLSMTMGPLGIIMGLSNNSASHYSPSSTKYSTTSATQKTTTKTTTQTSKPEPVRTVNYVEKDPGFKAPNVVAAAQAFANFHHYITLRDYAAAYASLSYDFQQHVGPLAQWKNGYSNTKASIVESMSLLTESPSRVRFGYVLRGEDYNVTRRFTGEVTVIKVGNNWVVDDISARVI